MYGLACPQNVFGLKRVKEASKWWTTLLTLLQREGKTTNLPANKQTNKQRERERERERERVCSLFPLFFQLLQAPSSFRKVPIWVVFNAFVFVYNACWFVCWPCLAMPCKDIVFRFIIEYR
jgi:hypothetical protein